MQSSLWFHFVVLLSSYFLMVLIPAEPLHGYNIVLAEPNEFPFVASLGLKVPTRAHRRLHFCTGSLITLQHILTAESCISNQRPQDVDVIVGAADLGTAEFKYDVSEWITYSQWISYHENSIVNTISDVAVMKLSSAVNQQGVTPVQPINLTNLQLHRTKAVIVGWDITNEVKQSSVLQKAKVEILPKNECEKRYKLISNKFKELHESTLCSAADNHALLSRRDRGGPLLDENNFLLGINACTGVNACWGNFSDEFLNHYRFNLHSSIDYCKVFILNATRILI